MDIRDDRCARLEEAMEKAYEAIDLLAWLHAEQTYRLSVLIFKHALSDPATVAKLKQMAAVIQTAKAAKTNGHVSAPMVAES